MTVRGRVRPLLASVALLMTVGCASSGVPPAAAPDVTGGRTIELWVRTEDRAYARYLVDRAGVLHFGGGMDAMRETYTWSGPLTPAELEALLLIADGQGWFTADPPSTGEPAGRTYTIDLRQDGRRRSFEVTGDGGGVAAAHALLDTAARRRHEAFIDGLPKPGARP